jgi:hypothetical protein
MTARQIKRRKYGPPAQYRAMQVSLALELWGLLQFSMPLEWARTGHQHANATIKHPTEPNA